MKAISLFEVHCEHYGLSGSERRWCWKRKLSLREGLRMLCDFCCLWIIATGLGKVGRGVAHANVPYIVVLGPVNRWWCLLDGCFGRMG